MRHNRNLYIKSRRNNYSGSVLSPLEAEKLASMITSVKIGSSKWMVDVYHNKNFDDVKNILKRFGTKYPYKWINKMVGFARYDCAGTGGTGANNAAALKKELEEVIQYGFQLRVKLSEKIPEGEITRSAMDDFLDVVKNLTGMGNYRNNDDDNEDDDKKPNNTMLYIGIGVAAVILFYLLIQKK